MTVTEIDSNDDAKLIRYADWDRGYYEIQSRAGSRLVIPDVTSDDIAIHVFELWTKEIQDFRHLK